MKKNFKNQPPTKRVIYLIFLVVLIELISFDVMVSEVSKVATGTYRLEKDFPWDGTLPYDKIPVSIVTSDYSNLSNTASRSSDIGYTQIKDMVYEAIDIQGSLPDIIHDGDTVMLKINLVEAGSYNGKGENTDNRVVKALMKYIDETVSNVTIIVAEGTARTNDDPDESGSVWEECGYTDFFEDSELDGVDFFFLNLNQTIYDLMEVHLEGALDNLGSAAPHNYIYKIHKAELKADVYISVPVLKIHDTGITCALKNQIGTAPACYYGYNKIAGTSYYDGLVHDVAQRRWTTEEIVDLSVIADIDYVLVDAVMCLDNYKRYNGDNQVRMNTIVAGADPVAVDHVCAKMVGINPDDVAHITLAEKMELGTNCDTCIEIVGVSLESAKKTLRHNLAETGVFGQSCRTWLLSESFSGTNIDNEYIRGEASLVPTRGADGWSEPTYFFDDRIDLLSYYSGTTNITSYAFTYFTAESTQIAHLWIGTEEDMKIFINGTEVYRFSGSNDFDEGTDSGSRVTDIIKSITVKKGTNTLLVKTNHTSNDYSFCLNICETEEETYYRGNRVEGLKFTCRNPDDKSAVKTYSLTDKSVSIYPNPATDNPRLAINAKSNSIANISVYNLNGQLVFSASKQVVNGENQISLNLSTLQSGGYYVCKVETDGQVNSLRFLT